MHNYEIKELRERLGLTQQAFAVKLGVAIYTVRRWETGVNNPSPMALTNLRNLEISSGQETYVK